MTITNTCTTYYTVLYSACEYLTSRELEESKARQSSGSSRRRRGAVLIHCFDLYTFLVWLVVAVAAQRRRRGSDTHCLEMYETG